MGYDTNNQILMAQLKEAEEAAKPKKVVKPIPETVKEIIKNVKNVEPPKKKGKKYE